MNNDNRKYHREYSRAYYHRRRREYVKLLGGKCYRCGKTHGLEFDHIRRSTKKFSISKLLNFSKKKVLKELKKCRLACKKCHKHRSLRQTSIKDRLVKRIIRRYATGKYSQTDLAKRYGVHQTTISKYVTIWKGG